jgi:hypothetical protein
MIRDGGSLAATFRSDRDGDYTLFLPIDCVVHDAINVERRGYRLPVLIDREPALRPADTEKVRHSALGGPASTLAWEDAHALITAIKPLADELPQLLQRWLEMMDFVTGSGGSLPPDSKQ